MRVAIAQINPTVGDIRGNARKIIDYLRLAKRREADIVVFPELALTGYPPEDLLLKPSFIQENLRSIRAIARQVSGVTAIIGFVDRVGDDSYNAAAIINDGKIRAVYHKACLPNYGVFDEKRYFKEGSELVVFNIGAITCGVIICEDIWDPHGPIAPHARKNPDIVFVINASPYYRAKIRERERMVSKKARQYRTAIVYANLVGGQDELVFDGQSFVADRQGTIIARADAFKEDLLLVDLGVEAGGPAKRSTGIPSRSSRRLSELDEIYQALVLGLKDYVGKNGFKKVLIGISGGIDSALTAVIARDALGSENVIGVAMPSVFTSSMSGADAARLARAIGMKLHTIPIQNIYAAYIKNLRGVFNGLRSDAAEENIQARIRGNLLMALSNKFGYLVLTTGNKSEISCGYCTLYGDMAGGFSVIKDVPKTLVYQLARQVVNKEQEIIPRRIITRAPTAELRPGQKDTDTLPPYEALDPIIEAYVEQDKSARDLLRQGFARKRVGAVTRMIDRNEYKRRQASPGIKITPKAFGRDRRMPITNRFTEGL